VRLLILGVGIGAIAGTVISAVDPSQHDIAMTASSEQGAPSNSESIDNTSGGAPPSTLALPDSGRSLVTPLNLGQEMGNLLTELQTLVGGYTDLTPGVFVYDLDTTNYLSVNGDNPFSAASTIKVPVLVAFFQDVEAGRIKLDDVLTMKENDVATGSGDMQFQPVGTEYTALETATKMIIISDNTATNMLIRKLGGAHALNRRFQSWGLTSTAIRNPLPDLEGTNTTSPRDLVMLMTLVSQGELLSLRSRDQMLHIMERTQTNTLLPQGVGPGAQIAHKTGDIGSMVGDVGLVDMPNGKRYGITVLVQRPHNDSRAQELIRQISKKVYDTLEVSEEITPIPETLTSSEEDVSDTTPSTPDPEVENPEFFGIQ
jgi:beta-lactamase class A